MDETAEADGMMSLLKLNRLMRLMSLMKLNRVMRMTKVMELAKLVELVTRNGQQIRYLLE
ncbi:hypothetical protein D3C77_630880 [compost metagenome]